MKIYDNESTVQLVQACISQYLPLLLRGETGTGKTSIIKSIAEKAGKTVTRINLTGQTTREDLVGKYILQEHNLVWQDGPLLTALKLGHWILLDEINAVLPEVLFVIQSLLESDAKLGDLLLVEKNGEILSPHPDSRIFATCNPSDYEGVKDLNMATLSRFVVAEVEPLGVHQEEQLLMDRYQSPLSKKLAIGADRCRVKKRQGETSVFVSTRDLELAAKLHKENIDEHQAIKVAILSKCQNDIDRNVINSCFDITIKSAPEKTFLQEFEELRTQCQKLDKENTILKRDSLLLEQARKEHAELVDIYQKLSEECKKVAKENKELKGFRIENEELKKLLNLTKTLENLTESLSKKQHKAPTT